MHGESLDDHHGHRRGGVAPQPQTDGHTTLAHFITAILSILATLGLTYFTNIAQGKTGQPGTTTVITKTAQSDGFCAYFGPDSSGHDRFQAIAPSVDAAGPWCPKGTFVSVVVPST